ncbi:MAG: SGNH/GDSL hydrolase family protein [Gammaproteobacteria bacterium]
MNSHTRTPIHILVFVALVSLISLGYAQPQHNNPDWVTTWATSPSTMFPAEAADDGLANQTVRLIVHTSVGGNALRIRLSNYHGEKPLRIGAVAIARQGEGANTVGRSQAITFSGQAEIVVPRWATVISDPIAFPVPQSGNLAVSIYLPDDTGFVTQHALANQVSYVSGPGNHSTMTSGFPVAEETQGWPFLTAIDVLPEQPSTAIVTLGDSITDGWGSSASGNQRWPNHFQHRLYRDDSVADYAVINAGISGNRVTTEGNRLFGQNLQARLERDVLAMSNVSHIVLLEGINDIGMSSMAGESISAAAIIGGYRQVIARAHARGIKVIGATLLPYEGAGYYSEAGNAVRRSVNDFIRNSGEFDGVIDFGPAVADPANPNKIRADFTEDNLHPNDAGYKAMADSIDLDLFR